MPNLNVPIVGNFKIINPPIDVQKKYYSFVREVDKSKLACKLLAFVIDILLKKEKIV